MDLKRWLDGAATAIADWQAGFGPFTAHPSLQVSDERLAGVFAEFTDRLGAGNYPFFHPDYAGPDAQAAAPGRGRRLPGRDADQPEQPRARRRPGHRGDGEGGGRPAGRDVRAARAPRPPHLQRHDRQPRGAVRGPGAAAPAGPSRAARRRTTRTDGCAGLLGVAGGQGRGGRRGPDGPGRAGRGTGPRRGRHGGGDRGHHRPGRDRPGARGRSRCARRHGVRVHVDAAYGGFFTLLARAGRPVRARAGAVAGDRACDSVVVDPHKHGLQPYGCGAVLFADPSVGRFYLHDSPYTYFTSDELHLGEISLECSRAGAAAAALWLTFRLLPPTRDGLGAGAGRGPPGGAGLGRPARRRGRPLTPCQLTLYQPPELDIVSYFPAAGTLSERSTRPAPGCWRTAWPTRSTRCSSARCGSRRRRSPGATPAISADADGARILRSVLMKPESETRVGLLHERLQRIACGA